MSEIYMKINNVSSKEMGVHVKTHRNVIAELSESTAIVEGRHGFYDYKNNHYTFRMEQVDFFVTDNGFINFRKKIREVADWLSQDGDIWFSDEPEVVYKGRCYSSPKLEQEGVPVGKFSAVFKCQPFAVSKAKSDEVIDYLPVKVPISYDGTAPSCCKIIIKNIGNNPISNLTITHIAKRR